MASGASSTTTVTVTVASATNIDVSGCTSGTANVTDLGTVLPTQSSVTTANCSVVFGSSNDTSMLRASQTDARGVSMFSPTSGALDTAFDTDGIQTTPIGPGAASDQGISVSTQSDGKIVGAGTCSMGGATGIDFCVVRYTTSGVLDTTFDTDGIQTTAIAPGTGDDAAYWIRVQPDGKIVVGGQCDMGGATGMDLCLARYTTSGALDTTFDTDGIQTLAIAPGANPDYVGTLALQADGKIVIGGQCTMGGATGIDFCLGRFTSSGALDTTFDTDGKQTTAIGSGVADDYGVSMTLQADGKILLGGQCDMAGATGFDLCVARYTTTGALDTTFDTDGVQTTAIGSGTNDDNGISVAVQADGKVLLGGYCATGGATGTDLCMARYAANGSLDTSFDTDGKQTTAIAPGANDDFGYTAALQVDGKILVGGQCDMGGASGIDMCLARYTSGGALDTTFDNDGKLNTAVGPGANDDIGVSVTTPADGKVAFIGACDMGGATGVDICMASYSPNDTFSQYTNGVTDWDTASSTNMFGACLASVSGGASAQWTTNAACPATDGAYWNPIATTADKIAFTSAAGTVAATANLRFGVRTSSSQRPGSYVAPITFDVLAPNT